MTSPLWAGGGSQTGTGTKEGPVGWSTEDGVFEVAAGQVLPHFLSAVCQ